MKLAFISDIHGNATALEAVLEDIHSKKVDQILVLGDLCFRGPEPKRALQLVQSLNTMVIKGNADEWVVRGINDGEVPNQALETMRREREWTGGQLDEEDLRYLESLPTDLNIDLDNGLSIYGFHATPDSLFDVVTPTDSVEKIADSFFSKKAADIFVYAHIHLPYVRYFQGKCVANLGSVGLPFDGTPKASYLLIETEGENYRVANQRVSYDINKVVQQYHNVGYPNAEFMANVIRKGSL